MSPVFLRKSAPIFGVLEVDFFKACFLSKCCLGPEIVSFCVFSSDVPFACAILVRCRFSGSSPVNLFFIWV